MDKIQPFIVLSHQRSGTTFLCNYLLAKHPEIFSFDELYNQLNHKPTKLALKKHALKSLYHLKYKLIGKLLSTEKRFELYQLDYLKTIQSKYEKKIIGFKLFNKQLPSSIEKKFLLEEQNKIILLRRRNIVQSAVSIYLLKFKNLKNDKSKVKLEPYIIDIDWCEYWIVTNRFYLYQCKKMLIENEKEFIEVEYESINDLNRVNEIYNYLGAKLLNELPTGMKKIDSVSKYANILNLEEFQKRLCNETNGYLF
tara:strand:+ start:576 stop:1334 length:759 start_codon:yes stop_codon:yes gene_type:complete